MRSEMCAETAHLFPRFVAQPVALFSGSSPALHWWYGLVRVAKLRALLLGNARI